MCTDKEDVRTAASMWATLSGQLMSGALAVIAVEGAIFVFLIDRYQPRHVFYVLAFLCLAAFVASIYKGGRGIAVLGKAGIDGHWTTSTCGRSFNWQAKLCLVGLVPLVLMVLFPGGTREDEVAKEIRAINHNIAWFVADGNTAANDYTTLDGKVGNIEVQLKGLQVKVSELDRRLHPKGEDNPGTVKTAQTPPETISLLFRLLLVGVSFAAIVLVLRRLYDPLRQNALAYDLLYPGVLGSMIFDLLDPIRPFSLIRAAQFFIGLAFVVDFVHLKIDLDPALSPQTKSVARRKPILDMVIASVFCLSFFLLAGVTARSGEPKLFRMSPLDYRWTGLMFLTLAYILIHVYELDPLWENMRTASWWKKFKMTAWDHPWRWFPCVPALAGTVVAYFTPEALPPDSSHPVLDVTLIAMTLLSFLLYLRYVGGFARPRAPVGAFDAVADAPGASTVPAES